VTQVAVVIPTLGSPRIASCLDAVASCNPAPQRIIVVHSGAVTLPPINPGIDIVSRSDRLVFAAAVNLGIGRSLSEAWATAVLNDDAEPSPSWLGALANVLDQEPRLAAVQGTVTQAGTDLVDGRGIELDRLGLPVQIDRERPCEPEPTTRRPLLAVSATAALYRNEALHQIRMPNGDIFDHSFGSYHEDLDVGLRLRRLQWSACWIPDAHCRHIGSASGPRLRWRHPWWVLANRWRTLAGNLTASAFIAVLPTLLRGELRAIRTLARHNMRAVPAGVAVSALLPWIVVSSRLRRTPGPRLQSLPRGEQ